MTPTPKRRHTTERIYNSFNTFPLCLQNYNLDGIKITTLLRTSLYFLHRFFSPERLIRFCFSMPIDPNSPFGIGT